MFLPYVQLVLPGIGGGGCRRGREAAVGDGVMSILEKTGSDILLL